MSDSNWNKRSQARGALRILEALSGVDEELLERSSAQEKIAPDTVEVYSGEMRGSVEKAKPVSENRKRRRIVRFWGRTAVACLAFLAVGVLSWNAWQIIQPKGGTSDSSSSSNGAPLPEAAAEDSMLNTSGEDQSAGGINQSAAVDTTESLNGGEEEKSEERYTDNQRNDTIQDESSPLGAENDQMSESAQEKEGGSATGSEDESVFQEGCPVFEYEALKEETARSIAVLGAYIPENLPAGYVFESAWSSSEDHVAMTWTRGMDSIMISVSLTREEMETVDVNLTEAYDQWLYEIPYGETVPEKYRAVFDDPLFAAEDLSLEVVSRRMKTYHDAGDTDTPRGSFSVLYPEGVVLHFNGRGTAEEIWDMLSSLNR